MSCPTRLCGELFASHTVVIYVYALRMFSSNLLSLPFTCNFPEFAFFIFFVLYVCNFCIFTGLVVSSIHLFSSAEHITFDNTSEHWDAFTPE